MEAAWYYIMPIMLLVVVIVFGLWAGVTCSQREDKSEPEWYERYYFADNHEQAQAELLSRYTKVEGVPSPEKLTQLSVEGTYLDQAGVHVFSGSIDFEGNATIFLEYINTIRLEFIDGVLVSEVMVGFESLIYPIQSLIESLKDPLLSLATDPSMKLVSLEPVLSSGGEAVTVRIRCDGLEIDRELQFNVVRMAILDRKDTLENQNYKRYSYADYKIVDGVRVPFNVTVTDSAGRFSRISLNAVTVLDPSSATSPQ
jgi:hypothetical protein